MATPQPALRPQLKAKAIQEPTEMPMLVQDSTVRERIRKEAALTAIAEYEAEHGEITADEIRALDDEWLR